MSAVPNAKRLVFLLFNKSRNQGDDWACEVWNSNVLQNGTGYSNLGSPIQSHHTFIIRERMNQRNSQNGAIFNSLTICSKTQRIYCWIETIVMPLLQFSFCESRRIRKYFKPTRIICRNNLTSEIQKLVLVVGKNQQHATK